jgi:site-specific DNA recombinase
MPAAARHTQRYAVIYLRVSTEIQAEKVSPQIQEEDALAYCEERGYVVVAVYRDTEKYRIGKAMVEPSGTRHDRPQFQRMIADAAEGKFDVIVAWREDRLYRGVNRAMLMVSELVQKHVVMVECVKDHYDPSTAAVKAWAAGIELESRKDRTQMGMKGRFRDGKVMSSVPPYGYFYDRETGMFVINPDEAVWLNFIFENYAAGVAINEIRDYLIANNAPQRSEQQVHKKMAWNPKRIRNMLKTKLFYTAQYSINYGGEQFDIDIPRIVSVEVAEACLRRREEYKAHPAGNFKIDALGAGLVNCASCGTKMTIAHTVTRHKKTGEKNGLYHYYVCNNYKMGAPTELCARSTKVETVDAEIWSRLWRLFTTPEELYAAIDEMLADIQARQSDASAGENQLHNELARLEQERQKVITWARREFITEEEMNEQLGSIRLVERDLRKQLQEIKLVLDGRGEKLQELAREFTAQMQEDREFLEREPEDQEEAEAQFMLMRAIVRAFVVQVDVNMNKELAIHTYIDLSKGFVVRTQPSPFRWR